jgi:uncharacterized protein RhaS with RHS repeats
MILSLGLYDYGKRFYDPQIGRFISIDAIAGEFPYWTSYAYAANSPILNKDLDGLEPANTMYYYANQTQAYIDAKAQRGEKPNPEVVKEMQKSDKNVAKTFTTVASFVIPISRLGYLGYAAATAARGFNVYRATAEVFLLQGPLLYKATDNLLGGDVKGSTMPSEMLYEVGYDKAACIIDLPVEVRELIESHQINSIQEIVNIAKDLIKAEKDKKTNEASTKKETNSNSQANTKKKKEEKEEKEENH